MADAGVCETATIHYMSDLKSDPKQEFFLYFALEGRRFKRTDTSMWCINVFYQEIWAVSARPKPPNHNKCKQKILTLQGLDFVTPLLHDDQEKNQLLHFMGFCPKWWRHGIVDPIFDLKSLLKWTQIKYQG